MKQIEVIIEKVEDVDFVVYPAEIGPKGDCPWRADAAA